MSTFDYTSRDYASIQSDLLARATTQLPEWTSREASDFGMMMVDLWAYMGDVLHYYVDRAAAEAFLGTATQRESVLAIANLLDYVPSGRQAAQATIQIDASLTTATDSAPIYIPQYTRFVATPLLDTATPVIFTSDTPIAFVGTASGASVNLVSDGVTYTTYPKTTVVSLALTEGEMFTETYTSTGLANQRITLRQTGVVTESMDVEVGEGFNGSNIQYTYTPRILDGGTNSYIYAVDIDADNGSTVVLGNGVNGRIPTTNATIAISYRRSRGSAGNVLVGAINALESTTVVNKPPLDGIQITPNTIRAAGGVDIESISSLKTNIPLSFRTQDRAVSLQDYEDILLRIPGITKATAYVDGSNVVQIRAVTPQSNYGSTNTLVLDATTISTIQSYLSTREITYVTSNVGASVTVTPVNIVGTIRVQDGFVQQTVSANVLTSIQDLFSFENMDFAGKVSLGDLYRAILDVNGVDYAVITRFTTTVNNVIDSSGGFTGVQASSTSLLALATSSTYTMVASGGIVAGA
jgi:hypothetical protein